VGCARGGRGGLAGVPWGVNGPLIGTARGAAAAVPPPPLLDTLVDAARAARERGCTSASGAHTKATERVGEPSPLKAGGATGNDSDGKVGEGGGVGDIGGEGRPGDSNI